MIRSALAVLMLVLLPCAIFAQVSVSDVNQAENFDRQVYGLGFSVGPASGLGISFRDHFPSKLSLQLVFGILRDKVNTFVSAGGEIQYDLVRGNTTRFYVASAACYVYNGSTGNSFESPTRVGLGVGGEFKAREALHVSLEGLFVYFSDGSIIPLPQLAFHYYFF
ncbi:MAG TPA: hypothetical protein VI758_09255 [Bacteroidota bacterium]